MKRKTNSGQHKQAKHWKGSLHASQYCDPNTAPARHKLVVSVPVLLAGSGGDYVNDGEQAGRFRHIAKRKAHGVTVDAR